jgi:hypothetical protein
LAHFGLNLNLCALEKEPHPNSRSESSSETLNQTAEAEGLEDWSVANYLELRHRTMSQGSDIVGYLVSTLSPGGLLWTYTC